MFDWQVGYERQKQKPFRFTKYKNRVSVHRRHAHRQPRRHNPAGIEDIEAGESNSGGKRATRQRPLAISRDQNEINPL